MNALAVDAEVVHRATELNSLRKYSSVIVGYEWAEHLEFGNTNKAFMELKGLARRGMGDFILASMAPKKNPCYEEPAAKQTT